MTYQYTPKQLCERFGIKPSTLSMRAKVTPVGGTTTINGIRFRKAEQSNGRPLWIQEDEPQDEPPADVAKRPVSLIDEFSNAIAAAGLTAPGRIQADGKIHRFSSNGVADDDAGWYVLHPASFGVFGDWRTGIQSTWKPGNNQELSRKEAERQRAILAEIAEMRESERKAGHEQAARRAAALWEHAQPATVEHGYLMRKGINPHGARLIGAGSCVGWLAVPMHDADGKLWNIERIAPEKPTDGSTDKKGLFHGKRAGCYYMIGSINGDAALCIAEGFATSASIHEATGLPVAVAFNAGNLEPVAKALRRKLPGLPMMICGDDDHLTAGNPGRTKAEQAAKAIGAAVVFPMFAGERGDKQTDFNDLHHAEGLEAVRRIVMLTADDANLQPASENTPAADSGDSGAAIGAAEGGDVFPDEEARPCFVVLDEWAEWDGRKWRPGVYYCGMTAEKKDMPAMPFNTWFCSPMHIQATTFDEQSNNFGRLLRFSNSLGRWREWAMPMELLRGSGDELRGELLAMGLEIEPAKARNYLPAYLQWRTPARKMRCAMQTGWAGKSFVLPDAVIGPDAAGVIFQSGERGHDEHTRAGNLKGWREGIAEKAIGNPLLLLALSASFAGPMLARCNAEGGGVHFVGDSSTGKTTAIEAACSIWGGANYRRSWRATANGLEGAAALFNDCLLALDEISECDPRQVGEIVYMLGNGRGKQRAGRSGAARGVMRWRCVVLSSGERSIGTTMADGGHRVKAGQAVRLLDIPAARKHGAWDELHGASSPAAFSDAIKRTAAQNHGLAGRAFLEKLTHDDRDFCAMLEEVKAQPMFATAGGEGQDKRAAARLALIGMAGELATEYGLTGWYEHEAIGAAAECFKLWQAHRGKGNDERRQIAERLSEFIDRHGDGRFTDMLMHDDRIIRDRAGWYRDTGEDREYFLTADAMREAMRGFDFRRSLDVLQELKVLPAPGSNGERARIFRIGSRPVKLYPINIACLNINEAA